MLNRAASAGVDRPTQQPRDTGLGVAFACAAGNGAADTVIEFLSLSVPPALRSVPAPPSWGQHFVMVRSLPVERQDWKSG